MATAPVTASTFPSAAIPSSAVWMNVANYATFAAAVPRAESGRILCGLLEQALSVTDNNATDLCAGHFSRSYRKLSEFKYSAPPKYLLGGVAIRAKAFAERAFRRDAHVGLFDPKFASEVSSTIFSEPVLEKGKPIDFKPNLSKFPPNSLSSLPDGYIFDGPEAFSGWTWKEMAALAKLGGISSIDTQYGCPVQCVGCYAKARRPNMRLNMDWDRQVRLAGGIKRATHAFRSRGIDWSVVDPDVHLALFDGSELVYLRTFDPTTGEYKGLYDSAALFYRATGSKIIFTTSGWPIENEFIHGNVTKLVRSMRDPSSTEYINASLTYSVKPFAFATRLEFDNLLDRIFEFVFNADDASIEEFFPGNERDVIDWARRNFKDVYAADPQGFKDRFDILQQKAPTLEDEETPEAWAKNVILLLGSVFFRDSRYIKRLTENIRFLETENAHAFYSIQYYDYKKSEDEPQILDEREVSEKDLTPLVKRYYYLFSKQFVTEAFRYAFKKATDLDSYNERVGEYRRFSDPGFVNEGTLDESYWQKALAANQPIIDDEDIHNVFLYHVYAKVVSDGALELVLANEHGHSSIITFTAEYLLARARVLRSYSFTDDSGTMHSFDNEAELLETLASLVGKNVFPG